MNQGTIKFESKSSEFLACSCGNDVMQSGFDHVNDACENPHLTCNRCEAFACVDYALRIVNNIDEAQARGTLAAR